MNDAKEMRDIAHTMLVKQQKSFSDKRKSIAPDKPIPTHLTKLAQKLSQETKNLDTSTYFLAADKISNSLASRMYDAYQEQKQQLNQEASKIKKKEEIMQSFNGPQFLTKILWQVQKAKTPDDKNFLLSTLLEDCQVWFLMAKDDTKNDNRIAFDPKQRKTGMTSNEKISVQVVLHLLEYDKGNELKLSGNLDTKTRQALEKYYGQDMLADKVNKKGDAINSYTEQSIQKEKEDNREKFKERTKIQETYTQKIENLLSQNNEKRYDNAIVETVDMTPQEKQTLSLARQEEHFWLTNIRQFVKKWSSLDIKQNILQQEQQFLLRTVSRHAEGLTQVIDKDMMKDHVDYILKHDNIKDNLAMLALVHANIDDNNKTSPETKKYYRWLTQTLHTGIESKLKTKSTKEEKLLFVKTITGRLHNDDLIENPTISRALNVMTMGNTIAMQSVYNFFNHHSEWIDNEYKDHNTAQRVMRELLEKDIVKEKGQKEWKTIPDYLASQYGQEVIDPDVDRPVTTIMNQAVKDWIPLKETLTWPYKKLTYDQKILISSLSRLQDSPDYKKIIERKNAWKEQGWDGQKIANIYNHCLWQSSQILMNTMIDDNPDVLWDNETLSLYKDMIWAGYFDLSDENWDTAVKYGETAAVMGWSIATWLAISVATWWAGTPAALALIAAGTSAVWVWLSSVVSTDSYSDSETMYIDKWWEFWVGFITSLVWAKALQNLAKAWIIQHWFKTLSKEWLKVMGIELTEWIVWWGVELWRQKAMHEKYKLWPDVNWNSIASTFWTTAALSIIMWIQIKNSNKQVFADALQDVQVKKEKANDAWMEKEANALQKIEEVLQKKVDTEVWTQKSGQDNEIKQAKKEKWDEIKQRENSKNQQQKEGKRKSNKEQLTPQEIAKNKEKGDISLSKLNSLDPQTIEAKLWPEWKQIVADYKHILEQHNTGDPNNLEVIQYMSSKLDDIITFDLVANKTTDLTNAYAREGLNEDTQFDYARMDSDKYFLPELRDIKNDLVVHRNSPWAVNQLYKSFEININNETWGWSISTQSTLDNAFLDYKKGNKKLYTIDKEVSIQDFLEFSHKRKESWVKDDNKALAIKVRLNDEVSEVYILWWKDIKNKFYNNQTWWVANMDWLNSWNMNASMGSLKHAYSQAGISFWSKNSTWQTLPEPKIKPTDDIISDLANINQTYRETLWNTNIATQRELRKAAIISEMMQTPEWREKLYQWTEDHFRRLWTYRDGEKVVIPATGVMSWGSNSNDASYTFALEKLQSDEYIKTRRAQWAYFENKIPEWFRVVDDDAFNDARFFEFNLYDSNPQFENHMTAKEFATKRDNDIKKVFELAKQKPDEPFHIMIDTTHDPSFHALTLWDLPANLTIIESYSMSKWTLWWKDWLWTNHRIFAWVINIYGWSQKNNQETLRTIQKNTIWGRISTYDAWNLDRVSKKRHLNTKKESLQIRQSTFSESFTASLEKNWIGDYYVPHTNDVFTILNPANEAVRHNQPFKTKEVQDVIRKYGVKNKSSFADEDNRLTVIDFEEMWTANRIALGHDISPEDAKKFGEELAQAIAKALPDK